MYAYSQPSITRESSTCLHEWTASHNRFPFLIHDMNKRGMAKAMGRVSSSEMLVDIFETITSLLLLVNFLKFFSGFQFG